MVDGLVEDQRRDDRHRHDPGRTQRHARRKPQARFACPEIDYGLVGGGAGLFGLLKMPEAKVRELLFTGQRFTAGDLEPTRPPSAG